MNKPSQSHDLDLDNSEPLDLFAEEVPEQEQEHSRIHVNCLSTLGCECVFSTLGCLF